MSKIKGMKNQKELENALEALVCHLEDWGGTGTLFQNVAKAQCELYYMFDGKTGDKQTVISMVQDYVMLLEKVARLEKEVREEEQA